MNALEDYNWPGNVRELENIVQRGVALCDDEAVDVCHLPEVMRSVREKPGLRTDVDNLAISHSYEEEVRRFKRGLIVNTLQQCGWRKSECARTLGVARGYLHRLINQLGIQDRELNLSGQHSDDKLPSGPVM
jgi:DNA-binding NtrC family response regulator